MNYEVLGGQGLTQGGLKESDSKASKNKPIYKWMHSYNIFVTQNKTAKCLKCCSFDSEVFQLL